MFVETSLTPNPNTVKFIPGIIVIDSGIVSFDSEESATKSTLARALFKIKGVSKVFFSKDFISVTKSEDSNWDYMKPIVLSCIVDHFTAGIPAMEPDAQSRS
ncbi:MAG: NifU N-terminal domain-containing protein, partial [Alphaproteobacteria bacterium]